MTLLASIVFPASSRILKSELKMDKMKHMEPDYRRGVVTRDDCPHQYPNNDNAVLTVIDSSANGYGMVATVTRPFDVNSDGNMLVVYRQYAGLETTHGQLGAGYSTESDGELTWDVQYNVNYNGNPPWGGGGVGGGGTAQARYPSGIASEDYPYAIWNEYTGNVAGWPTDCSDYGGRPYFSYDEFGWGGESWLYPSDLDPGYVSDCTKDLWTGSVGYGYDAANDEHHVNVVYDDWSRTGSYLFQSEAVEDGYIILGNETLGMNPQHLGTDGYSSAAILSMNDNGQGLLGVDGIFAGVDMDSDVCTAPASSLSCDKTPMFRMTDDFGSTWYGDRDAFDLFYIPEDVFEDIFTTWNNTDVDPCTGEVSDITDYWSWYEFDMRVDQDGDPHIVVSLIAESDNYFHFIDGQTGFYHFTIDRDVLDGFNYPGGIGAPNTPTGWNWSYIPLPANDSFNWNRPDGGSYLYGAMCQISLSRDNPDIVYMVANIAEQGDMSSEFDANGDGVEDDPCGTQDAPWELYPNWSEDIFVAKSSDNGSTWTALENLTNTPRDPNHPGVNNCQPEEQYVHTAHWSDDERVYFQYNQPNWGFNEIGDPLGADHMNRVFLGYAYVAETGVGGCTDVNDCNYNAAAAFDDGSCAAVLGTVTCPDGTAGCGCDGVCNDSLDPFAVEDCNGVCDGGAITVCNSVESGGGVTCVDGSTEICSQGDYDDGLCENLNSWYDCDGLFCGDNDPLYYETGCAAAGFIACDGGRCYTCDDGVSQSELDCQYGGGIWEVATDAFGDIVEDEASCQGDWVLFVDDGDDSNGAESGGDPDECYCTAENAEVYCELSCTALGDLNGDEGWNVLDIVTLANCVLANNCGDLENGCAGDMNGDEGWNVLDIVTLANCVLANNCGGRVSDATESQLFIRDNQLAIEANGFIGGVEMTLSHGPDFSIDVTDRALYADYLTTDNQTRVLVITPETDQLFSFSGKFEIEDIIVANTQYEVSVQLPTVVDFKLSEAYPNPFNPTTTMSLTMPVAGDMDVTVYNIMGQSVETLSSGYKDAGSYTITWDASSVSSGMYFVKAQAEGFTQIQKLMLVK